MHRPLGAELSLYNRIKEIYFFLLRASVVYVIAALNGTRKKLRAVNEIWVKVLEECGQAGIIERTGTLSSQLTLLYMSTIPLQNRTWSFVRSLRSIGFWPRKCLRPYNSHSLYAGPVTPKLCLNIISACSHYKRHIYGLFQTWMHNSETFFIRKVRLRCQCPLLGYQVNLS